MEYELTCPRCKTTKYRNPSLKLMVNICGHTLCESCVELLFLKGSGSCPECRVPLRRNNYRTQLFEDPNIEKEVDIRRRILRDYNKKEEDFKSLEEYNDYLEDIEHIIYNLCNNIDIIETNKKIEAYKRENRDIIQKNKSRLSREEFELAELVELERMQEESRRKELAELESEQKRKKQQTKDALLTELIHSGKNPDEVIKEFAEIKEKLLEEEKKLPPPKSITEFSTGIKISRSTDHMFLPLPKTDDVPLYKYEDPIIEWGGPTPPSLKDIEMRGSIKHIRSETEAERAGGYTSALACQHALQEALQGLFFRADSKFLKT